MVIEAISDKLEISTKLLHEYTMKIRWVSWNGTHDGSDKLIPY